MTKLTACESTISVVKSSSRLLVDVAPKPDVKAELSQWQHPRAQVEGRDGHVDVAFLDSFRREEVEGAGGECRAGAKPWPIAGSSSKPCS